jgi:hypothetical protein
LIRGIISAIVLFAVATVLTAAPCLACVELSKHADPCCDPGKCKKVTSCVLPGLDFVRAEPAAVVVLPAVAWVHFDPAPLPIYAAPAPEPVYSPPDLYLLTPVLNV